MAFEKHIAEHKARMEKAMAMGGPEKLARRKAEGILNARERKDYLVDEGSFLESGLFGKSVIPEMQEKSPADGKIAGYGKVDGREVALVANDFTVLGASSSDVNGKKIAHMKEVANKRGIPLVFLGESTGARMPDHMGAKNMGKAHNPTQYQRMRETPWVSAIMGYCFGSSAWYSAMSDIVIMRKGSVMAVASPRLSSMATGEEIDPEVLGGWRMHSEITGIADVVTDTDEEALDAVKKVLSYFPSHRNEAPPRMPVPPGSDEGSKGILDLVPESPYEVYDVRRVIRAVVDLDSLFELKAAFGRTVVTGLARIDGRSVGIIASNPMYNAGALDADACEKVTSFLVLCDSFNIPIIIMVDQPGFMIGLEGEKRKMPGKIMNWMNAISLCTVPKIEVIMRKNFGQAYLNVGGGGNADEVVAWWTADVGFMDPVSSVLIVHGVTRESDPDRFQELLKEMAKDTTAYDMAAIYGAHAVIDPRETRSYLVRMLEINELRLTKGVGQHLMRTWPTTF